MRVVFAFVALAIGSGCSIHPNTEDFSRESVPQIVRKVKCEARDAVIATVGTDTKNYLMETGVAFAFDFIMDETNEFGSEGTFGIPVPNGTVSIGFGVGEDKNRKTQQRVTISDTFGDLVKAPDCGEATHVVDYKYPITGEIGLSATFENYKTLMDEHKGNSLLGTFEDEIGFKTDLAASASARVKLVAVTGKSLDVSGSTSAARTDIHRVKLTFTPAINSYQLAERQKVKKQARLAELKRLSEEKSIPTVVQVVGPDNMPIDPKAHPQGPRILGLIPEARPSRIARPSPAASTRRPSSYEMKVEALRTLERSDARAFQDSFRREFEPR